MVFELASTIAALPSALVPPSQSDLVKTSPPPPSEPPDMDLGKVLSPDPPKPPIPLDHPPPALSLSCFPSSSLNSSGPPLDGFVSTSGSLALAFVLFGGTSFTFKKSPTAVCSHCSFTAICRFCLASTTTRFDSGALNFFPQISLICWYSSTMLDNRVVSLIRWECEPPFVIVTLMCALVVVGNHCHGYSFMEAVLLPNFHVVLKGFVAGKKILEILLNLHMLNYWQIVQYVLWKSAARAFPIGVKIAWHGVASYTAGQIYGLVETTSHILFEYSLMDASWTTTTFEYDLGWCFKVATMKIISQAIASAFVVEAFVIKAALIAAINVGFRSLTCFLDSLSLDSLLNSLSLVNELKYLLHDIRCLSEYFTSLSFVFIPRSAIVVADVLAKFVLVSLNSLPNFGN